MSNFTIKVTRFTPLYPEIDPDSYIVGFSIECNKNKRRIYKEKRILYKEIKSWGIHASDEKITEYAWEQIKPLCKNWCKETINQFPIKKMSFMHD